jgi:hypothetical protein
VCERERERARERESQRDRENSKPVHASLPSNRKEKEEKRK